MAGGDFVWILQHRKDISWNSSQDCSFTQKKRAAEGLIFVSDYDNIFENEFPISGMVRFSNV